jgi:hypothetical protein
MDPPQNRLFEGPAWFEGINCRISIGLAREFARLEIFKTLILTAFASMHSSGPTDWVCMWAPRYNGEPEPSFFKPDPNQMRNQSSS